MPAHSLTATPSAPPRGRAARPDARASPPPRAAWGACVAEAGDGCGPSTHGCGLRPRTGSTRDVAGCAALRDAPCVLGVPPPAVFVLGRSSRAAASPPVTPVVCLGQAVRAGVVSALRAP